MNPTLRSIPSGVTRGSILLLASLLPAGLAGQAAAGVVRGRVLTEESGRPVAGAEIRFRGGPAVMTNRHGEYRAVDLAEGWHEVAVVTAACEVALGRVQVVAQGEWITDLSLPDAVASRHIRMFPGEGTGVLLTAGDLNESPSASLADALRRALPELGVQLPTQPGRAGRVQGRNRATLTGSTTPLFIVDGMRMGNDPRILWDIPPGDVVAVEVLRGAAGAWRYGADATGGMIRIHTRGARGEGMGSALPASCPPPAWGGVAPRS